MTYILTQYINLEKFDDMIKEYTTYTEIIGNFLSTIISTADMKIELRPNGDSFILSNKDIYSEIYRKSPYINHTYWKAAVAEYENYLKNTDVEKHSYLSRKRTVYTKYAKCHHQ